MISASPNWPIPLAPFLTDRIASKNGFQVTRQLKTDAATSGMKVLLLSSKDQDSDKFWGMKQGADEYLTKPFDEDALLAAVARLF